MELGSPLQALHIALASALYRDLDDIHYDTVDWAKWDEMRRKKDFNNQLPRPTKKAVRRPVERDVEILMFSQSWGSTALGYGGMGGSAVTPAYTTVVFNYNEYCVYFGEWGELAYKIKINDLTPEARMKFVEDLQHWSLPPRNQLAKRYGLPENDQSSDI